jgi:two-component system, NarL family, response regulator DevR
VSGGGASIRLVLVDDHTVIRHGLRAILEREPDLEVVGESADAAGTVLLLERTVPDIVLLDIRLHGVQDDEGLWLCRQLTTSFPTVKVIVLSSFLEDRLVLQAIQHGAKGYVLKDVDVVELVRDVRAVYAGGTAFESRSADVMLRSLTGAPADGHGLTEREREVTWLVAQGLSNRVIGEQLFISQSTVKFHLNNIMVKLGVSRRAGLVYVAGKQGLL